MSNDRFIMLKNVRVSFPHLFERSRYEDGEGKFGATLLLDPATDQAQIKAVQSEIQRLLTEKLNGIKLSSDRLCLRARPDRAEYGDSLALSANSNSQPVVIDVQRNQVLDKDKNPIYPGCYVNAKISLWAQSNKHGKRVNANLVAIQFAADGDSFSDAHVPIDVAMAGFDDVVEADDMFA